MQKGVRVLELLSQTLEQRIAKLQSLTQQNSTPNERQYKCNNCKDVEWVVDAISNTAKPCKCREVNHYKKILEVSGMSEAFYNKTFENYNTDKRSPVVQSAKKNALDYAMAFEQIRHERNNSIAFIGQVGAGKTHLAAAIANYLLRKGIGVLYINYRDSITYLKQNIIDQENYQAELGKYKKASVLLIDDLYKGKRDKDDNIIYEIVNHRYFNGLPMIITTEYDCGTWIDYDEAIGSRLMEMCKGNIVSFQNAANYRLQA
jgi:DNA replication protein DnaC